jgi:transposase
MRLPGIGPVTATATSTIGHGHDFSNGRSSVPWLGLVPGAGTARSGLAAGTHPAGDSLRSLLVLARVLFWWRQKKQDEPIRRWA